METVRKTSLAHGPPDGVRKAVAEGVLDSRPEPAPGSAPREVHFIATTGRRSTCKEEALREAGAESSVETNRRTGFAAPLVENGDRALSYFVEAGGGFTVPSSGEGWRLAPLFLAPLVVGITKRRAGHSLDKGIASLRGYVM